LPAQGMTTPRVADPRMRATERLEQCAPVHSEDFRLRLFLIGSSRRNGHAPSVGGWRGSLERRRAS
jgi:hypothetical protein